MDDEPFVTGRLDTGQVEAVLKLWPFDIDADVLTRELSSASGYCWMGSYTSDGRLAALHRAMRWHRYLLLKGVCVDDAFRASGAALRTAFAIRDWAGEQGFAGVVAWVEVNRSESQLANRLRIHATGPLLHRYLVPLPSAGAGIRGLARCTAGTLDLPAASGRPIVDELLGIAQDGRRGTRLAWTLDRSRLVLSGNPCSSVAELDILTKAAAELVPVTGATALEVPFEATDLHSALSLAGTGSKRLSRSPVQLGMARFRPESSRAPGVGRS